MHVVGSRLAPFIQLVPLNKRARKWIVLFEFEVACSFIIAQSASNCKVLRPSVENNMRWLAFW